MVNFCHPWKPIRVIILLTSLGCTLKQDCTSWWTWGFKPLPRIWTAHSCSPYTHRPQENCSWLYSVPLSRNSLTPHYPSCITNLQWWGWSAGLHGAYRSVHESRPGFCWLDLTADGSEKTALNLHFLASWGNSCWSWDEDCTSAPQR